ncbi:MAG: L,D-transpeptidase family protein [Mariprofundaceae bacterium]
MMKRSLYFCICLCLPLAAWAVEDSSVERLRVLDLLESSSHPVVNQLSDTERLVLMATLALRQGKPLHALDVLKKGGEANDPLVAMLEAEAYRRSALQSVLQLESGHSDARQQLEAADLSPGMAEADVRLDSFMERLDGAAGIPLDFLELDQSIYSIFLVDKGRSRMFVYARNASGKLKRVADEYIVTGANVGDKKKRGDARTPNGVYRFVKRLQGKSLPSRYGPVAYPIDYPNELDLLHHKDGSGIWMHGYAMGVGRRPPRDTKGCFALPNMRLLQMSDYVKLGQSWVVVGENFTFDDEPKRIRLRESVHKLLNVWRRDWVSLDSKAYLRHYHPTFHSGKRNLAAWKAYKTRLNARKSFIEVKFSNMSLLHDPNVWPEGEVVVAEFNQHYRSSNYKDVGRKRLYLARSSAQDDWKILLEESVKP